MTKDENKVQAYVNEKTRIFLNNKAGEKGVSTSKYIAQILNEHVEKKKKNNAYKARVINILGYILSCVYDKESVETNSKEAKDILDFIKQECNQAFL